MRTFGQALYNAKRRYPSTSLLTWKSNVSSAFLNLPAHPLWQLHQVVKVDGQWHIVCRLVFGNRASPRCWCAVAGLMCWIRVTKLSMPDLHDFMDDFFSWDVASDLVEFKGRLRPMHQAQLLIFWDAIGCPWEEKKQEYGECLKIIGFWVDINRGTISLTKDSINDIIAKIKDFIQTPNRRPPLRVWQRLAGHLNWLLNVLPWGRPVLSSVYRKIASKSTMHAGVFLNREVVDDMNWFLNVLPTAVGIKFLEVTQWDDSSADFVLWTDVSLKLALAFVYAGNGYVYPLNTDSSGPKVDIFFLELLAILSAIHHVGSFDHPPKRLLVFTDSLDAVAVLNSLGTSEDMHNSVVKAMAGIIIETGIDLRVRHIAGKDNTRADLLSRLLFDDYHRCFPADHIHDFEPPRDLLPARWNRSF